MVVIASVVGFCLLVMLLLHGPLRVSPSPGALFPWRHSERARAGEHRTLEAESPFLKGLTGGFSSVDSSEKGYVQALLGVSLEVLGILGV